MPEVRIINIMDDSLLNDCRAAGGLTKAVTSACASFSSLRKKWASM